MLTFFPWKIEQEVFAPEAEAELEKQLAFSNGYISEYGFFEESYSGEQSLETYLRGIPVSLPPSATVSVRLGEEGLNLHKWQVLDFYRCLHRQEPLLERRVTARSPLGRTLSIMSSRQLSLAHPQLMTLRYEVRSLDYSGPVSLLSLLGDAKGSPVWYPLKMFIDDREAVILGQAKHDNYKIAIAMTTNVIKNGQALADSRIRIEKSHILGYSVIDSICPNDTFVIEKKVAFLDSLNYPDSDLFSEVSSLLQS